MKTDELKTGLIGEHLSHSLSPMIHSLIGEHEYGLYELAPEELGGFLKHCPLDAFNVTIPYKKAVIPYLDGISREAARTGAVNTVVKRGGKLYGHNTDVYGLDRLMTRSGIDPHGKKVLILGSGGASAATRAVCEQRRASQIVIISRTGKNNYENIENHSDTDIIVNATPAGMYPECGASPVDLNVFGRLSGVIDLIYNPYVTRLLYSAERRGTPNANGLYMLIAQAFGACSLFYGEDIPDRTDDVIGTVARRQKNILLIGMPGCGKSVYGKKLAEKLGRPFYDTDTLIEQRTGKTVPELINGCGEEAFRRLETDVLDKTGRLSGAVIAAGGGAVTREENYYLMHRNSEIVYIERELGELAVQGRPLSEKYGVERLFAERKQAYERFADRTIKYEDTDH